jgi:hypothetical protein
MENLNMLSEFFATNKTQSYSFRIQKLKQLQQSLLKFEGELLDVLRLDLNKPMIESYAGEIAILHNEIKHILVVVFTMFHWGRWSKYCSYACC